MKLTNNYRLLQLKQLLFNETDELHELNMDELKERLIHTLQIENIDNRTIKNDLNSLESMDFEIMKNKRKYGKIYYSHQAKLFETYQLRLLVDAILSARFITPKEKTELIDKLKEQTSVHIRQTLPGPILFSQTINLDYEQIKINIDKIHRAIAENNVLRYKYGDYNVHKNFEYRRDGTWYYVEPYALIWQNDLYYLIGRFQQTNEIRHYRLDRIRKIEITDHTYEKEATFELQPYIDNTFHMYSGEEVKMKVRFKNSLINAIYDHFGFDVDIMPNGSEHFILTTKAKLSDGLVSWILKWGRLAEVLSPELLVEKVRDEVEDMMKKYEANLK